MSTAQCEAIGDELVAFLDGELTDEARRPVAAHVASCLVCRREVERLTVVRRWVAELPAIEPSPTLAEGLWERIAAAERPAASPRVRVLRPWRWAVPALAAAAVVALAFSSQLRPRTITPTAPTGAPPERVAAPAPVAPKPEAPAVAAARPAPKEDAPQVAQVDDQVRPEDLRLEDLPPELAEQPELFLRLPVVRRLETLEHFDAVRDSHGDDAGGAG